ncbi:Atp5c1p, partial [Perkinsus olseni]
RLTILSNHFKSVISFDTWENRVITLKECREMDRKQWWAIAKATVVVVLVALLLALILLRVLVAALMMGEWSKAVDQYSFEPSVFEVLNDLHDFYVANCVFGYMLDSIAAEQSARMSAMENASKNAADMIDRLELQFNKARQSKITTELCEIISGASSLPLLMLTRHLTLVLAAIALALSLEGCGGCGGCCCCGMCACEDHRPTQPVKSSGLRDRVLRHEQKMQILRREVEAIDCDCDHDDEKTGKNPAANVTTPVPRLSRQSSALREASPTAKKGGQHKDHVRIFSSVRVEPPLTTAGSSGVTID